MHKKFFEKWVCENFNGLSPHTLCQAVRIEKNYESFIYGNLIDEMVYVLLYNYAIGKDKSDKARNNYDLLHEIAMRF